MTWNNYRTPLLYYIKLCASFQIHQLIQTGVTVQKRSIRVKISNFFSHVTLIFYGWPWKIIGHLFYATLSFVHHFKVIREFKLELQSGNPQFRSKSAIFCPMWPWNLMEDLEKHRVPFLYYIKHCASFQSHGWIKTGVTVRKHSIQVKIDDFFSHVTLKCHGQPWKMIGHLFYATSSFVHHFEAFGEFKLELQSENAQFGSISMIFFSRVTLKFDRWPWKTIGHLS